MRPAFYLRTGMSILIATKTLDAINSNLEADGGDSFRANLKKVLPHISDIYRQEKNSVGRGHLGASVLGSQCARQIWYGFHWAIKPKFPGRILRLFNRGHLEEARVIALLLSIGVEVYQQDSEGKQFRVEHADGHVGGSGDGVVVGLPDLNPGMPCLLEIKTHNDKSWKAVHSKGVKASKFEHYVQMCIYGTKMGLNHALYVAVNKNDDSLHLELVPISRAVGEQYLERGAKIVNAEGPPNRIGHSIGDYRCVYCDYKALCHGVGKYKVERNCRTCAFSEIKGKDWVCRHHNQVLTVEEQKQGCSSWQAHNEFT